MESSLKLEVEIHSTADLKLKITKYSGSQQRQSQKSIEKDSSLSKRLSHLVYEARSGPPSTPGPTVLSNGRHTLSRLDKNFPLIPAFRTSS